MARDNPDRTKPDPTLAADISLVGPVDEAMACRLRDALASAEPDGAPFTIDMTTMGGNPEMARRMIADLEAARERLHGRRFVFLGKTAIYSAGCTFMAGFPRADRYLTQGSSLLIHCRQLKEAVELDGPIRASIPKLKAKISEIETGIEIEEENFRRLVEGSKVPIEELLEKALYNWYLTADEAAERGLVAGVV